MVAGGVAGSELRSTGRQSDPRARALTPQERHAFSKLRVTQLLCAGYKT